MPTGKMVKIKTDDRFAPQVGYLRVTELPEKLVIDAVPHADASGSEGQVVIQITDDGTLEFQVIGGDGFYISKADGDHRLVEGILVDQTLPKD